MKKWLKAACMLGMTAGLYACGSTSDAPGGQTAGQLNGKLSGWTYGTQGAAAFDLLGGEFFLLNSSSIGSDGTVNFTLPTPPNGVYSLTSGSCTFTGTNSNPSVGINITEVIVLTETGDLLGNLSQVRSSDNAPISHMYATSDVTYQGRSVCGSQTFNLNLTLKAGWNPIIMEGGGTTTTLSSVPSNTSTSLRFFQADKGVVMVFKDTSAFSLMSGQTISREVTFYQVGALSGEITLSTNVPGVTVTPQTLTLPKLEPQALRPARLNSQNKLGSQNKLTAQTLKTTLTFGLNGDAVNYSGPLKIAASQNGQVLDIIELPYVSVSAPSVDVTVNQASFFAVYRGEQASLPVQLQPQNGFSGPVTISLSNLPAGVSATPVTVTVTANSITSVNVPLDVSASAPLGQARFSVTGRKITANTATVQIMPARTLLNSAANKIFPAKEGVWVALGPQYDATTSGYTLTLQRWSQGVKAAEVTFRGLNDSISTIYPISGGDLYVVGALTTEATRPLYHLKDDGTFVTLSVPKEATSMFQSSAADAQGRIWHFKVTSQAIGLLSYGLFVWNPVTKQDSAVDTARSYEASNSQFRASQNGRYLLYRSYDPTTKPILLDTQTQTTTEVSASGIFDLNSVVVSNSGQVWFVIYNALTRINTDGSSTTFPLGDTGTLTGLIGVDPTNPNLMWLTDYHGVRTFDATSAATKLYPTDEITPWKSVLNPKGGITFMSQDKRNSPAQNYLSTLP